MGKITERYQVTIPRHLAEEVGVRPGDEVEWEKTESGLKVTPAGQNEGTLDPSERLRLFDQATRRQRRRQQKSASRERPADRGWKREDLYDRGNSR